MPNYETISCSEKYFFKKEQIASYLKTLTCSLFFKLFIVPKVSILEIANYLPINYALSYSIEINTIFIFRGTHWHPTERLYFPAFLALESGMWLSSQQWRVNGNVTWDFQMSLYKW